MTRRGAALLGDLAVFGFAERDSDLLRRRLPRWLGAPPRTFDFGSAGCGFFYSNHGEVAESSEVLVLKLGLLRTPAFEPLSAQDLVDRRLLTPGTVDGGALRGNALVACCGKRQAGLIAYGTLLAVPQLYYVADDGGILCATDIRCLLALADRVEIDDDALPQHFLFRSTLGERTYFRGIRRLFPGHRLRWQPERLTTALASDLRRDDAERTLERLDAPAIDWLAARQSTAMGACLREIEAAGRRPANLLSGGEDSAVIQLLLAEQLNEGPRSFSFALREPDFVHEIDYALQASVAFGNRHALVEIEPDDYPRWLVQTVEILAQPALLNEAWPCFLALADHLHAHHGERYDFFSGQGADALHGLLELPDLVLYQRLRGIPGAAQALRAWARLSRRAAPRYVAGLLAADKHPGSVDAARFYMGLMCDLEEPCRWFGEAAVRDALEERCALEERYLGSAELNEQSQTQCLLSSAYDPAVACAQMFAARRLRMILFFLDEDVIRSTMAFAPTVRFRAGKRLKPLQKALLERGGHAALTGKSKGGTCFNQTFFDWTHSGPLRGMVGDIELPGFMSRRQLDDVRSAPNHLLWSLLTLDLFQRRIL